MNIRDELNIGIDDPPPGYVDPVEKAPALVPFWLDIILFMILCGLIALAIVLTFSQASILMGAAIIWGGALSLLVLRTIVKRLRQEWV